jgi:hypothetical protein
MLEVVADLDHMVSSEVTDRVSCRSSHWETSGGSSPYRVPHSVAIQPVRKAFPSGVEFQTVGNSQHYSTSAGFSKKKTPDLIRI